MSARSEFYRRTSPLLEHDLQGFTVRGTVRGNAAGERAAELKVMVEQLRR
jgi:hypothetical protein